MFRWCVLGLAVALTGCGPSVPQTNWAERDAHWARHEIDAVHRGADGVRVADINNDGLSDIAVGWEESGLVKVYFHPGVEQVRRRWPDVIIGQVVGVEDAVPYRASDGNRYHVLSLAEGKEKSIYLHRISSGESDLLDARAWSQMPLEFSRGMMQWMYAVPFDVDGRGGIDIVAAGKNDAAQIGWISVNDLEEPANWTWQPLADVGWVMSIEVYDVNLDGRDDIVYSDRKGEARGVHVIYYDPEKPHRPFRGPEYLGGRARELMFMAIGSIDQDELPEIIVPTTEDILVLDQTPNDGWVTSSIPFPDGAGTGKGIALADVDGDRRAEIVLTSEHAQGRHGVYYLKWNDGDWLAYDIGGRQGTKFDRVEMLDIDGDGDLDVLTCEESENLGVIWYENPLVPH